MNAEKILRGYKDGSYDIDEAVSLLKPTLEPYESMAVTIARGQIKRNENPPINTTAMLLVTIERLTGSKEKGDYQL